MRSSPDDRRERLSTRWRARGRPPARTLSRAHTQLRRDREDSARLVILLGLWAALAAMLLWLAQTLWRVAQIRLVGRALPQRLSLPAVALLALVFCALRARSAWRELGAIRARQDELRASLRQEEPPPDDGN
jgi:hypothetical protein